MNKPETKTKTPTAVYLLLSLTLLLVIRAVPLFKGSIGSFGYDYGFYLYAASHLHPLSLSGWLVALWGGYSNPLFYLAHAFFIPPNIIINQLYLLFTILLALSFYWFFGTNKKAAAWAVILCATSLIQTESYAMFLWKNWAALPFLILAFKFYRDRNWRWLTVSAIAVALTHRTTLIILLLTLAITFTVELNKEKKYQHLIEFLILVLGLGILGAFLPQLRSVAIDLLQNNNSYVRTGLFLERQNLFTLLWPYLLLALPGAYLYIKNKQPLILTVFTVVCGLWYIFHLPFYHRFLIYLDLSLIFYSAYFLGQQNFHTWLKKISLACVILFLTWQAYNFASTKLPLISRSEIQEIKNFNQPGAFILAVSADDAPWLLGFAQNARLGAPGLLEDPHTFEEWNMFWQNQNQINFISKYPRPLYFYQRSYRMQNGIDECFLRISENFYQYNFNCANILN